MEVSVIGSSQVNLGRTDLGTKEVGLFRFSKNLSFANISSLKNSKIWIGQSSSVRWPSKSSAPFLIEASAAVHTQAAVSGKRSKVVSFFSVSLCSFGFHFLIVNLVFVYF